MVMVGLVTAVTTPVGSVTSTCLRSSFGDMTTLSGPMWATSSGPLSGQSSTTSGLPASLRAEAAPIQPAIKSNALNRILLFDDEAHFHSHLPVSDPALIDVA